VPLVLVPGFTQTAASWDPVLAHLPPDLEVVAVDVPSGLGFVETAAAIGEREGRAGYAGYSMGGRLCLRFALDRPDLVRGLVLLSASPDGPGAPRSGSVTARGVVPPAAPGAPAPTSLWICSAVAPASTPSSS